ncbi:hypothetical protein [Streptomyces sp. PR69]|uniref:hypothetical protein n=1 Tax=Streptomyces sp. PR69 TaxID=2984950 RepID=UPI00226484F5|nr:hypothetical protein [Streptomyces sp. PR69]
MSAHGIPVAALLIAFAVTAALAWLAGGRRRGVPAIGAGLLAVQGALHLIFSGGQPAAHHMPARGAHRTPHTHGNHGQHAPHHEMTGIGLDADTGMLAAHLLAALICAVWLARGEAAFFRLARTVGALAFTPLRLLLAAVRLCLPEPPRPAAGCLHRLRADRGHGVLLAHTLVRRGPPPRPAHHVTVPGAAVV